MSIGAETFFGSIETTRDALLIFEAARQGILQRVKRRISHEQKEVRSAILIHADDQTWIGICV
jgi:hypothetical protein